MGNVVHKTVPVWVKADIDEGIADFVRRLNRIPGVRTHASCQGTIGEGGAEPYEAYVSVSWRTDTGREELEQYRLIVEGDGHGCVHPPAVTTPEQP